MKRALDEFIGVSPQTRIDIDDIARRSRAIRRRRRSVAVCLAGLAVVGVAAIGVAAIGVAVAPAKRPTTPAPAATKTTNPAKQATPDRLFAALKAAIKREAPQVTGVDGLKRQVLQCTDGGGGYEYVTVKPGIKAIPCVHPSSAPEPVDREYIWFGQLKNGKGTYNVRVLISLSKYYDPDAPPVNAEDAEEQRIAAEQGDAPKRGPNGENYHVDNDLNMVKPDNTGIMIRTWDTKGPIRGQMTRGPFTPEELTAIGLDPALHM
jgi:hypothetical protein